MRDKSGDGTPQHIGMLDTVPDEETLEIPRVNATDDFVMLVSHKCNKRHLEVCSDYFLETIRLNRIPLKPALGVWVGEGVAYAALQST